MHRRVLFFIDNDSARFALIKQASPSVKSRELLWACSTVEARVLCLPWYARVPSASNIGDGPSRLEFAQACRAGVCVVKPRCPAFCVRASVSLVSEARKKEYNIGGMYY